MSSGESTDREWKRWGDLEPYYGVCTDPRFKRDALNEQSLQEFFDSGRQHVDHVLGVIRQRLRSDFAPTRVLDYGCGVGRIAIPLAQRASHITGVDIAPGMLVEAKRNAASRGAANVQFFSVDRFAAQPALTFDLIHSFIVFQHIRPKRGEQILRDLIRRLEPLGIGAIHITFASNGRGLRFRWAQLRKRFTLVHRLANLATGRPLTWPVMQMNSWSMNRVLALLYAEGGSSIFIEYSFHGAFLGAMLYFEKVRATPI
jgi:SAM-dependent methyltransferase